VLRWAARTVCGCADMARIAPDRAALEIAHRRLLSMTPLDEMLKNATLRIVLEIVASRHMLRRTRVDVKKLQANDRD
jgi:hypothetical protein